MFRFFTIQLEILIKTTSKKIQKILVEYRKYFKLFLKLSDIFYLDKDFLM